MNMDNGWSREYLIELMDQNRDVRWKTDIYKCYKDKLGQYLCTWGRNNHTIGIFHQDGVGMNIDPKDCYIRKNYVVGDSLDTKDSRFYDCV